MMKKLFVLMLALGLAATAQAGVLNLDVEVGGSDYAGEMLGIGTEVTVKVHQVTPDADGAGGVFWLNFAGTNSAFDDTTPTFSMTTYEGWQWLLNGSEIIANASGQGGLDLHTTKNASPGVGTPGEGSILGTLGAYTDTIVLTFEASESHLVQFVGSSSWDSAAPTASEMVNVIPEPMTIALLGLGGLFLRRRK